MPAAIHRIDLHGYNRYQAQIAIESALKHAWGVYVIRLVHGYHQGTSLRDFIRETYQDDPRIIKLVSPSEGCTDLYLRNW